MTPRDIKKKDLPDYSNFNFTEAAYTNLAAALQDIINEIKNIYAISWRPLG